MMASFTWTGSTGDGNHDTAGNWLGGVAPTGTGSPHTITFDRGNYSMTSNISAAYAISALYITSGFGGNIGSTSAAYVATGDITTIMCAGRGQYYKIGASGNVGTSLANRCQISLASGSQFVCSSGTWQYYFQQGGTLLVESAAVMSTYSMLIGVTGLLQTNATAVTLMDVDGATSLTTYRTLTAINANAQSGVTTLGSAAVTSGNFNNSVFNMSNTAATTHALVNLRGGSSLSLQNATANQTLTNLYRWKNTGITGNPAGITLTVTNTYAIYVGSADAGSDIPA